MNINFLSVAQIFLVTAAVIYRIISWTKKEDNAIKHYAVLSEIYVAALIIMIGLGHQSKCVNPKEVITIHDTILTHGPLPDEVIPGINPHWNDIPETTFKKKNVKVQ